MFTFPRRPVQPLWRQRAPTDVWLSSGRGLECWSDWSQPKFAKTLKRNWFVISYKLSTNISIISVHIKTSEWKVQHRKWNEHRYILHTVKKIDIELTHRWGGGGRGGVGRKGYKTGSIQENLQKTKLFNKPKEFSQHHEPRPIVFENKHQGPLNYQPVWIGELTLSSRKSSASTWTCWPPWPWCCCRFRPIRISGKVEIEFRPKTSSSGWLASLGWRWSLPKPESQIVKCKLQMRNIKHREWSFKQYYPVIKYISFYSIRLYVNR